MTQADNTPAQLVSDGVRYTVLTTSCVWTKPSGWRVNMLKWAAIFLVIAIVAALLGFTGIAGAATDIARFLFFLFLAICVIMFVLGISTGRRDF